MMTVLEGLLKAAKLVYHRFTLSFLIKLVQEPQESHLHSSLDLKQTGKGKVMHKEKICSV